MARPARWGNYVEPDFPFYSSVVDARRWGATEGWPTNNLTPRGLILKPGPGVWACFDTELLRVAAIWEGDGLTPVGMAPGSYHDAGHKAQPGETELPEIRGTPWLASGLYPGWQSGAELNLSDPRPPAPDVAELARGPLDPALARFRQVRLIGDGVSFEYVVAGSAITERMEVRSTNSHPVLQRAFAIGPRTVSY